MRSSDRGGNARGGLRPYARLAAFLLVCALGAAFCNTFLVRTDTVSAVTMRELYARDDIELALVGSSVVRYHFNPEIIARETGLTPFCASILSSGLQADIVVTKELLRRNAPEWIVLVLDTYNLERTREDPEAEYVLMPHLRSWRARLDYYLRLCREDGQYLDRLLLFRQFGVESFEQLANTVALRLFPDAASRRILEAQAPEMEYRGAGYLRRNTAATPANALRRRMLRSDAELYYELFPETQEMLAEFRALCEGAGAKLMVVYSPTHPVHALAENTVLHYGDQLGAYCRKNGIPFLNFLYANERLLPDLTDYYFDLYHLNGEGSDLFSEAFSHMFAMLAAGEDVSGYFYASRDEYLASLDYITNAWIEPAGGGVDPTGEWIADCNRGPTVTPEYAFLLLGPDGEKTTLRDYAEDPSLAYDLPEGYDLRVLARPKGSQDAPKYYDYPADFVHRLE